MSDEKDVIPFAKFKAIVGKAKAALTGSPYEPSIYIDTLTLMKCYQQSELHHALSHMKSNTDMITWDWNYENGHVKGVTITCYNAAERGQSQEEAGE